MSADNWAICPKCEQKIEETRDKLLLKAKGAYGEVSEGDYLELIAKAEQPINLEETLREDYFIGITGGELQIEYSARCDKCGFKHTFNKRESVNI